MSALFQINRKVRDNLILNLRRIFSPTNGETKYPYVETVDGEYDFDATKIIISDMIPQEHAFYPAIIVDTISGPETRYLGPDTLGESKDTNFEVQSDELFASLDLTVNINIYTIDDTITRDEIADRIYDQFKLITDDLADNGIEIKRVIIQSDRRAFVNDRWYLTGGLTLEVYTEWKADLGVTDRVEKIPIQLDLDLSP